MFVGEQRGPGFYLNAAVEYTNADNPNERIFQPRNDTVPHLIQHHPQVKVFGQIISFTLFDHSSNPLQASGIQRRPQSRSRIQVCNSHWSSCMIGTGNCHMALRSGARGDRPITEVHPCWDHRGYDRLRQSVGRNRSRSGSRARGARPIAGRRNDMRALARPFRTSIDAGQ